MKRKFIYSLIYKLCLSVFFIILTYNIAIPSDSKSPSKPLLVAFAHWPPWKIIETDNIDGIDARIIRSLSQKTGIEIDFYECPWPRCIDALKEGEVDLITSLSKTPDRQKYTHYLGSSYWNEGLVFWVKKDSSIKINQYEDLYNKRIGAIKGSVYFPVFDHDDKLIKSLVDLEYQLFLMLQENRLDTFIGYETVMNYQILLQGFKGQFKKTIFRSPGQGSHIAMSKKSKFLNLKSKLTKALELMQKNGEIKIIIDSFLEETAPGIQEKAE